MWCKDIVVDIYNWCGVSEHTVVDIYNRYDVNEDRTADIFDAIHSRCDVDSMREAVLTVSPNKQ